MLSLGTIASILLYFKFQCKCSMYFQRFRKYFVKAKNESEYGAQQLRCNHLIFTLLHHNEFYVPNYSKRQKSHRFKKGCAKTDTPSSKKIWLLLVVRGLQSQVTSSLHLLMMNRKESGIYQDVLKVHQLIHHNIQMLQE